MRKLLQTLLCLFGVMMAGKAAAVVWYDGSSPVSYHVNGKRSPVVGIALDMFSSDMEQVTGHRAVSGKNGVIQVYQLNRNANLAGRLTDMGCPVADVREKMDGFWIGVHKGKIVVAGNNGRGCAYGLLELSRMAGVSPWVWWGDVVPERKSMLNLDDSFTTFPSPSVAYRCIFIK